MNFKNLKKLSFKKIFYFFVIFSFFGCVYEELLYIVNNYLDNGTFDYVTRRGVLYFELSPVYGFGAIIMILIFSLKEYKKIDYFWLGSIIGGAFEYIASLLQELLTGTISWNYSTYFLNINGRTTIPFMLFWGLLSYILMTKVYPVLSNKLDKIPRKYDKSIYYSLLIIVILDLTLSFSACIRLGLRHKGYEPLTFYGKFLDTFYDDERMKRSYTNMVDVNKE